jgi:nucleotide-binding universal stress UspA family protein
MSVLETQGPDTHRHVAELHGGRTGLTKVVLGSVAERVVRTSTCPVMTVRGA